MIYEWDETKRAANLAKHGVDFESVRAFDWDNAFVRRDLRRDYGEPRWWAFGPIGHRLHLLVFTRRDTRMRIISLRKANGKEILNYETKIES
jgi:uncharacterized DUF497 family protein